MVAGKHDALIGQEEAHMAGGVAWCDACFKLSLLGQDGLAVVEAPIDLKRDGQAFQVGEYFRITRRLLGRETMAQESFLALIMRVGSHPLLGGAFSVAHDNLDLANLADTRYLTAVIAMKVRNDNVRQGPEVQPKIAQLPL
jgi:hypothetical protein